MTDTKVMSNEVNEVVESAEVVTTTAKKKRSPLARVGAICAVVAACACMALPVSATGEESESSAFLKYADFTRVSPLMFSSSRATISPSFKPLKIFSEHLYSANFKPSPIMPLARSAG